MAAEEPEEPTLYLEEPPLTNGELRLLTLLFGRASEFHFLSGCNSGTFERPGGPVRVDQEPLLRPCDFTSTGVPRKSGSEEDWADFNRCIGGLSVALFILLLILLVESAFAGLLYGLAGRTLGRPTFAQDAKALCLMAKGPGRQTTLAHMLRLLWRETLCRCWQQADRVEQAWPTGTLHPLALHFADRPPQATVLATLYPGRELVQTQSSCCGWHRPLSIGFPQASWWESQHVESSDLRQLLYVCDVATCDV